MTGSEIKYLYQEDFLEQSHLPLLFKSIDKLNDTKSITVTTTGYIQHIDSDYGHIKNYFKDETILDSILDKNILLYKNKVKNFLSNKGYNLPLIRGIYNYYNPNSIVWHKDFIPDECTLDPSRRIVTFFIISRQKMFGKFMVAPSLSEFRNKKIGMEVFLKNNSFICHNQCLGHAFTKILGDDINILSMVWYDLRNEKV